MKTRPGFSVLLLAAFAVLIAWPGPHSLLAQNGTTASDANSVSDAGESQTESLRQLPAAGEEKAKAKDEIDYEAELENYVPKPEMIRDAFLPPPGSKPISEKSLIWVDRKQGRVYVDGYVAMRDGLLEMFACPIGTKEHESVVGTVARSDEVHAGLLAVGAQPGTPVTYLPNFVPATGQRIRVWVCYWDDQGKFQAIDARRWIKNEKAKTQMQPDWVFAGSGFWKDPGSGREYYRANSGDMICVSNFSSAMLDVPIASSSEADQLQYIPFTERIPKVDTPIRLVLIPIPLPDPKAEKGQQVDPNLAPAETILPRRKPKAGK